MPFRIRRSIRILPGVRWNFGKRGGSISIGGRGATVNISPRGTKTTLSIPGTGLSYTTSTHHHKTAAEPHHAEHPPGVPLASPPEPLPKGKAWRGWLWIAFIIGIAVMLIYGAVAHASTDQPAPSNAATVSATELRGTEAHPVVIAKSPEDVRREGKAESQHATNEFWTTVATICLAIFTVLLWLANVKLILDARRISERQASDSKRSIDEAKRSADAMHEVAEATKNNAALMSAMLSKQMRAYISVDTGSAIYQDANLKFEAQPLLTNNGLTPARRVCFKVMAGILDGRSLLDGTAQLPPVGDLIVNDGGVAPRQSFTIRGILDHRLPDADVPAVMVGNAQRLFAWGRITYEDVFGGQWETKFCINYAFQKVGNEVKVHGGYHQMHNSAT